MPSARVLRPVDLVDLVVDVEGATLRRRRDAPARLTVDDSGGTLTVTLAPQHLGEEAFEELLGAPEPSGLATHRAARRSRLVYDLPGGLAIDWTVDALLALLPTLRLRVVPLATPGPDRYPEDESPSTGPIRLPPWIVVGPLLPVGIRPVLLRPPVAPLAAGGRRKAVAATAAAEPAGPGAAVALPSGRTVPRALLDAQGARLVRALVRHPEQWGIDPERIRIPIRRPRGRPRAPRPDETALEVPYRLVVSPSAEHGAFTHEVAPTTSADGTRTHLWHTRLTTRLVDADGAFAGLSDDPIQRIVRAVWTRDLEPPDAGSDADVALMAMNPRDRRTFVRQTAAVHEAPPTPLRVRRLHLSALGAWVDWRGAWDTDVWSTPVAWPGSVTKISSYRHIADMGRDSYVRITYPGFLFPFGHRAELVKLTERKVHEPTRTAYLRQRHFIVLRETVRSWPDRDTPFTQVQLSPSTTPDLDPPVDQDVPFFPLRGGEPFRWDLATVDRAGETPTLSAPLLFVSDASIDNALGTSTPAQVGDQVSAAWAAHATIDARGQNVSFAASVAHGDTRLETNDLTWDGHIDVEEYTSRPHLTRATAVIPSLRHLAPQAPGVQLTWADAYLAPDPGGDVDLGFGAANPSGLFLGLASPPVAVDFGGGSDRAGGFVSPNQVVRALSRDLGTVGDDGSTPGGLADGRFDAREFLKDALPKLFGLFDLIDLIEASAGGPLDLGEAPAFVTEALDAISSIVTEAQRLADAGEAAVSRLDHDLVDAAHAGAEQTIQQARAALDTALAPVVGPLRDLVTTLGSLAGDPSRIDDVGDLIDLIEPRLPDLRTALAHPRLPAAARSAVAKPLEALDALLKAGDVIQAVTDFVEGILTPNKGITARFEWRPPIGSWPATGDPVFKAKDERGFGLAVEVRAGAESAPQVDVSAELRSFALQLLPGEGLMSMDFSRIGFRVGSGTKPEVDVVFDGMHFLGALGFIEKLREMIPFDGFADPPYVDVSVDGVTAGFDLELPNVAVGVFSLENISLGADARVPFLGDAVTVGFHFCTKDSPFRLTVMCIGGGGWVAIRLSPKGLVELEMGLEACASLSIDLGVASGSVSIAVGVYLKLEADKGSLTGYFRIRGEVDVLGLISASITLELSLTYHFDTGKLIGKASLVIEVEVLFFSASVTVTCERKLAGSKGDPVLAQIMPPDPTTGRNDDWSEYCAAFAPGVPA
jgi:hypothetical protein